MSQGWLAEIESGKGGGASLETWFGLAQALGLYLRFEFGRDPQAELRDAGHLAMQELVLRVGREGGWERLVEALSRTYGSDRSIDVRLTQHATRQVAIAECWNTFGDLGEAMRSGARKLRDAREQATASVGGAPYRVGLVWIVRDTKANRELVARYAEIFAAACPGSSERWLRALVGGAPMPAQPGLVWCDVKSTRLFARRTRRRC